MTTSTYYNRLLVVVARQLTCSRCLATALLKRKTEHKESSNKHLNHRRVKLSVESAILNSKLQTPETLDLLLKSSLCKYSHESRNRPNISYRLSKFKKTIPKLKEWRKTVMISPPDIASSLLALSWLKKSLINSYASRVSTCLIWAVLKLELGIAAAKWNPNRSLSIQTNYLTQ